MSMTYYISAVSDIGRVKEVNQDCIFVEQYDTPIGAVALAVLCDGMGGLQFGEVASATIVSAFADWAHTALPALCCAPIGDQDIRTHWTDIITRTNEGILQYGQRGGFQLGSTVTALLITETRYFALNIGDSRLYEIGSNVQRITTDHTLVENEVKLGNLTPEQAEDCPIRNILTKCVGVSPNVAPDMYFGTPERGMTYMLCSDGFRHSITPEEMQQYLLPINVLDPATLQSNAELLVALNMQRGETDNISVISIYIA